MKALRTFFLLLISLFLPGTVLAGPITGFATSSPSGGITATENWANGNVLLAWNIFQSGNLWYYNYLFKVKEKDISGIIFQVSNNFTSSNIFSGTTSGWELQTFGTQGNSTPGIPSTIKGLKFGGTDLSTTVTIVSDRDPMAGNFYAVDGKTPGREVFAYNSGWGTCSGNVYSSSQLAKGCIPVPDTMSTIPAPSALALLTLGLAGLGFSRQRRLKYANP